MTTIESLIALLPCPFGKGTPKKSKSQYGHYIQVMQPCPRYGEEEVYRTPYFHEADELYAFWNTRTTQTNVDSVAQAIKASLKYVEYIPDADLLNAARAAIATMGSTDSSIQKPGMEDTNPQVCKQPAGQCIQTTDDKDQKSSPGCPYCQNGACAVCGRALPSGYSGDSIAASNSAASGHVDDKDVVNIQGEISVLSDKEFDEVDANWDAVSPRTRLMWFNTLSKRPASMGNHVEEILALANHFAGGNPERHKAGASAPVGTSPGQLGDALNTAPPAPATESPVNKHFDDAKEYLRWLRKTASSIQDNARIVGFEDCLFTWKKSLEDMKPVSVSLEKVAEAAAAYKIRCNKIKAPYTSRGVAKAVLDAAEVAYVE